MNVESPGFRPETMQDTARHIVHTLVGLANEMGFDERLELNRSANARRLRRLDTVLGTILSTERLQGYLSQSTIDNPAELDVHVRTLRGLVVALFKDAWQNNQIMFSTDSDRQAERERFIEDGLQLIDRKNITAV